MKKNNIRYERKFFISYLTKHEVESVIRLHPGVFSEIYHERRVNNIYMDSFDMVNYFDNVIGLENRVKVRIRWYGDLVGDIQRPVLELKTKKGLVCSKSSFSLSGFKLDADFSKDRLHEIIRTSGIPDRLKLDLRCMEASLLNSYTRRYYLSRDKKYRLTLDSDLEFCRITGFKDQFLDRFIDHVSVVLEAKYSEDCDTGANKITSFFPFRMTKSSKYIMGIDCLNLHSCNA